MTEITSLQHQLEQYSLTVKGQTSRHRSAAEIAGYAAAAGAALAMAGTADASIIYSGVQNISVQINPNAVATRSNTWFHTNSVTRIDIDGDGSADMRLYAGLFAHPTKWYNGYNVIYPAGGAGFLGGRTPGGGANVSLSHIIGPDGTFGYFGPEHLLVSWGVTSGGQQQTYQRGNFALGVTGIAGIQLGSGNYGWIRVRIDDLGPNQPFGGRLTNGEGFPDKLTLIDWAYDNSGAPIHVADIPEPSSLLLLASGAAGIAAFRRRKAERRV